MVPKVGIIVLNFNGEKHLEKCLSSLRELSYDNFFVIVVDNNSQDDSFFRAKEVFPEYTYVKNEQNTGFAAGMNVGIRVALTTEADFVWLMNNDAEVRPDALQYLVTAAENHPSFGMLSPVIVDDTSKSIWFERGKINFWRMRADHCRASAAEKAMAVYESDYLTGCALFIRKEVLLEVGLLDERYFLYYEDADYSLRVRQTGYQCGVIPQAVVYHAEKSRQNKKKTYFLVLSGLLFFSRYETTLKRAYLAFYVTIRRIKNAFDRFLGREGAFVVQKAYHDFFYAHPTAFFPHFRKFSQYLATFFGS